MSVVYIMGDSFGLSLMPYKVAFSFIKYFIPR